MVSVKEGFPTMKAYSFETMVIGFWMSKNSVLDETYGIHKHLLVLRLHFISEVEVDTSSNFLKC
jgi:hypothetical protein